jgi:hypothetical protein
MCATWLAHIILLNLIILTMFDLRLSRRRLGSVWSSQLPLDSVGSFLGSHFYSEDGGNRFLRNIRLSPNYTALEPYSSVNIYTL